MKPKIKKTKLNHNPLFIKFLNWKGDKYGIEFLFENLMISFEDDFHKNIVREKILDDAYLNSLSEFQKVFKKHMNISIQNQTVCEEFLLWLNNAYKYIVEEVAFRNKEEIRKISIKDANGKWFEAIVCYNFIMTFNYFGLIIIKKCPICGSYFAHKYKYARYCSDGCLEKGKKK